MANILAIDYGRKRVGLAVADEKLKIPVFLKPIAYKKETEMLTKIHKICKEKEIKKIIIGLPLSFNFQETSICQKIKEFGEKIRALIGVEVDYENEILSTEAAKSVQISLERLKTGKKEHYKRQWMKNHFDSRAAAFILETYLKKNKT